MTKCSFWVQFGMHYALDACKRSLYCICTGPCCTLTAGMYENNIQFAEKSRRVTVRLALPGATANTFISLCVYFPEVPLRWPHPWDMQASQVQKHNETHASRKTHKKKCRCYIIKDALCWFRLGEACGQEMDTWTFCGCFLSGQKWTQFMDGRHRSFDVRDFQTPDRKSYGHITNSFHHAMIVWSVFLAMWECKALKGIVHPKM